VHVGEAVAWDALYAPYLPLGAIAATV